MSWSRLDPLARFAPSGPKWTELRARLFAGWGPGTPCYYCGCPVLDARHGVVAHVISWRIRPDLAWNPSNLVPSHGGDFSRAGGANKRCPRHDLDCNWTAHNHPAAPRDADKSLPFGPAFLVQCGRRPVLAAVPAAAPPPRTVGRAW